MREREQDDEERAVEDAAADAEKGGDEPEHNADEAHHETVFELVMRDVRAKDLMQHDEDDDEDLQHALDDGHDIVIGGPADEAGEQLIAKHTADHAADGEEDDHPPIDKARIVTVLDDADGGHGEDGDGSHGIDGRGGKTAHGIYEGLDDDAAAKAARCAQCAGKEHDKKTMMLCKR